MTKFKRIFVIGAYMPNGGTYMAYHLGKIIHDRFSKEVIVVQIDGETYENGIQSYDTIFPTVSLNEMKKIVNSEDLLIANPSFSGYNFGISLPCKKLMYIQGFNTFQFLDMFFDRYVCASTFIQNFISQTYDLHPRVIPPFIQIEKFPDSLSWKDRPKNIVLVHLKGDENLQQILFSKLQSFVLEKFPDIRFELLKNAWTSHMDLVKKLGQYRYLITLAVAEGFGLIPLEAMAMGTAVIGFDGFGGRQYMQPKLNCLSSHYPNIEEVAAYLVKALRLEFDIQKIASLGKSTAGEFTYARFKDAWINELESFID